ncbi:MAG: 5-formyltetrahydrofolate cyclo-ligase [Desulfuromonadales bacterium]
MPKTLLRSKMLARRRQLATDRCLAWSLRIQQALAELPEFVSASAIGLYSSVGNEVFTEELFRSGQGKKIAYPRVLGNDLEFVQIASLGELCPGTFGILEPIGSNVVSVASLDLIVVPGVAFDLSGHRLGYGKGFYDRVLHDPERGTVAGLAFERQLVEALPAEQHDIRMDLVITENRLLRFDRQSPNVFQHYFHGGPGR